MYTYIYNPVGFENINGDIYTSDVSVINEVRAMVPSSLGNEHSLVHCFLLLMLCRLLLLLLYPLILICATSSSVVVWYTRLGI